MAFESIQKIFILLRNRTGNDLSAYKPTAIKWRIARRMNIHQIKNLNNYVQFLQENTIDMGKLFTELLIFALQRSNEDLDTAKEEIQSLNEEFNIVNNESQNKIGSLSDTNDDMQNLLNIRQ